MHGVEYRALTVQASVGGIVEQDANVILRETLDACRAVVHRAAEAGVTLVALALATQRGSAVLWDTVTGAALAPAVSWQDGRHADRMASLRSWDNELIRTTGRPSGGRSPYLWAADQIETGDVARARAAGRLAFGTMESWLLWHLTEERVHVSTATVACSAGGYLLEDHAYKTEWIEALGFPSELLPPLRQDVDHFGVTDADAVGISVPVLAAVGDQHAGMVGLGCLNAGQAMCLHGTGSFVDLLTGTALPGRSDTSSAALTLTAWRRHGESRFSVESFTATTGSALDWASGRLGWFESSRDITRLAETVSSAQGVMFLPALAGLRVPMLEPRARAVLSGLSMETSRADIAFAILEGVAHSVASGVRAVTAAAGIEPTEVMVGGGLSSSDPLIQMQADLVGVPMRRPPEHEKSSLRGAAFLAGADGLLWNSLEAAVASLGGGDIFEPRLSAEDRDEKRTAWESRVAAELRLLPEADDNPHDRSTRQQER